jgi:hypothetical protein
MRGAAMMTMTHEEFMRYSKLWEYIGKVQALADPDGPIATSYAMPPEERLAQIWAAVRELKP